MTAPANTSKEVDPRREFEEELHHRLHEPEATRAFRALRTLSFTSRQAFVRSLLEVLGPAPSAKTMAALALCLVVRMMFGGFRAKEQVPASVDGRISEHFEDCLSS